MDIRNYTHIVFGFEHYNPLGIVRSLGEKGIRPIGIIIKGKIIIASTPALASNPTPEPPNSALISGTKYKKPHIP